MLAWVPLLFSTALPRPPSTLPGVSPGIHGGFPARFRGLRRGLERGTKEGMRGRVRAKVELVDFGRRLWYTPGAISVRRVLGSGSYGTVFLATWHRSGKPDTSVIIKRTRSTVRGADEMARHEHFFNQYITKAAKNLSADFLGYVDIDESERQRSGTLSSGRYLVWRDEGSLTLRSLLLHPPKTSGASKDQSPAEILRNLPFFAGKSGGKHVDGDSEVKLLGGTDPLNSDPALAALAQKMGTSSAREGAVKLMKSLLEQLMRLHEIGVIHRDIKPSNLLLPHGGGDRNSPVVKLIDLAGCADLKNTFTNYHPMESVVDPLFSPPEEYVMPTDSPDLRVETRPLVARAKANVLWAAYKPDRFDLFPAGITLLQLAIPSLRTDKALRSFRSELESRNYNLNLWRRSFSPPASPLLDAYNGTGWDLAEKLLRPRQSQWARDPKRRDGGGTLGMSWITQRAGIGGRGEDRISAAEALSHSFFRLPNPEPEAEPSFSSVVSATDPNQHQQSTSLSPSTPSPKPPGEIPQVEETGDLPSKTHILSSISASGPEDQAPQRKAPIRVSVRRSKVLEQDEKKALSLENATSGITGSKPAETVEKPRLQATHTRGSSRFEPFWARKSASQQPREDPDTSSIAEERSSDVVEADTSPHLVVTEASQTRVRSRDAKHHKSSVRPFESLWGRKSPPRDTKKRDSTSGAAGLDAGINNVVDGQNADVDGEQDSLQTDVDGVKGGVDGVRADSDGVQADVDGVQADVDGVQANVDGVQADVDGVQGSVNNHDGNANRDVNKTENGEEAQKRGSARAGTLGSLFGGGRLGSHPRGIWGRGGILRLSSASTRKALSRRHVVPARRSHLSR